MPKLRILVFTMVLALLVGTVGAHAWSEPRLSAGDFPAAPIRLRSGTVYLNRNSTAEAAGGLSEDGAGLFLVQFKGPVRPADKAALLGVGAELGDYIPENAFLARMTRRQAEQAAKLPAVRAVGRYTAKYKVDPALAGLKGKVAVRAVGFGGGPKESMAGIQATGAPLLSIGDRTAVAQLSKSQIEQLARSESVVYLEPVRSHRLFNDKAAGVIKVPAALSSYGLDGAGQVVGLADTGIDTGDVNNMHPDLKGRVKQIFALGRQGDASDPHGHGTHVAGSIAGTGAASGGKVKGMAPNAQLVFQSVLDSSGGLGGIPENLIQLFDQSYQAGARIHSNSWGVPADQGGTVYDSQAAAVDRFIWEHGDFTILFAAGNDGDKNQDGRVDYGTVSTPGTAKNAITVGASENDRPEKGKYADNVNETALFSSRGTTGDGRIKPDVVAPGSWVLSTKSSRAPERNFWQGENESYAWMGGTSMATPVTAGATALVREYFMDKLNVTPKASLLKAALVNGALAIQGSYKDYGFGRVDLERTLAPGARFENEPAALNTGDSKSFSYQVEAGSPLKITLAWSDYPANPSANKTLVNDLDLEVTAPDGTVLKGNSFLGSGPDRTNNVEQVAVDKPVAGTYTVTVKAYNVPQGPQPFSLAVSGKVGEGGQPPQDPPQNPGDKQPPTVRLTAPADGATLKGIVTLKADASDADSGLDRVEFYVGTYKLATRTAAPFAANWDTATAPNGKIQVKAKAYDKAGNTAEAAVTVIVDNQQQTPPQSGTVRTILTGRVSGWSAVAQGAFASGVGDATLKLQVSGRGQAAVAVYSPEGRRILFANARQAAQGVKFRTETAGTYSVTVYAYLGVSEWKVTVDHPAAANQAVETFTGNLSGGQAAQFPVKVGRDGVVSLTAGWSGGGDLDLYLLDSWGQVVSRSDGPTNNPEGLSVSVKAGTYTAMVVADSGEGQFTLTVRYPQ